MALVGILIAIQAMLVNYAAPMMQEVFNRLGGYAVATVLGVTIASAGAPISSDCPQWRGPNRDGVSKETGLLKDWPAGVPKLAWKATGLGKGYSTVAVAGGKIFTIG